MNYRILKQAFAKIRHFPVQPQWFAYRDEQQNHREIAAQLAGVIVDIGCADQYMRPLINAEHHYVGLDYYDTATNWYQTRPQVFGDAQYLPFADASIDNVLLLDVLEHLPQPELCITEIARILKPNGRCILQVPFLYPIHDNPLDFQRWTLPGLQQLAQKHSLQITATKTIGKPLETAALLCNIALVKTLLNWIKQRHPAMLLGICAPPLILLINLIAWGISLFSPSDEFMPHSYHITLEKI
ncbi:MAG: class I SAM-dependent methyltransferase [Thiotrichaceae bacterium]